MYFYLRRELKDIAVTILNFYEYWSSNNIFVFSFQEIVPLSAGNVLVIEDNEPAAKWLALISQALNRSKHGSAYYSSDSSPSSKNSSNSKDSKSHFFQKPSLKVLSKNFRAESSLLKSCNCPSESHILHRRRPRNLNDISIFEDFVAVAQNHSSPSSPTSMSYRLIASKQMVGIFLSVWARKELVQHIGHLRISCVGRGIMGCLRNKASSIKLLPWLSLIQSWVELLKFIIGLSVDKVHQITQSFTCCSEQT